MQRTHRNSNVNREEQYEAVDPFKASVVFSMKNLFGRRNEQQRAGGAEENDLTSLPAIAQKDSRRRRVPAGHALPGSSAAVPQPNYHSERLAPLPQGSAPTMVHGPVIPDYVHMPPTVMPAPVIPQPVQSYPGVGHSVASTGRPLPGLDRYFASPFNTSDPPPPVDHTVIRLRHSRSRSRYRSRSRSQARSHRRHRRSRSASRRRSPVSRSPTRAHHHPATISTPPEAWGYPSISRDRRRSPARCRIASHSPDRRSYSRQSPVRYQRQHLDQINDSPKRGRDSRAGSPRRTPPRGRSPTSLRLPIANRYSPVHSPTRQSSLSLPHVIVSPVVLPQEKRPRFSTSFGSASQSQSPFTMQPPPVPHIQLPPTTEDRGVLKTAEGSASSRSLSSERGRSNSPVRQRHYPLPSQPIIITVPIIPSGENTNSRPATHVDIPQKSRSRSPSGGLIITEPLIPSIIPETLPTTLKARSRSQSPSPSYFPLPSRPIRPLIMPTTASTSGPLMPIYSSDSSRFSSGSRRRQRRSRRRRRRGSTEDYQRTPEQSYVIPQSLPMPMPIAMPPLGPPVILPNIQMPREDRYPANPQSSVQQPIDLSEVQTPIIIRQPSPGYRHRHSMSSSRQRYSPTHRRPIVMPTPAVGRGSLSHSPSSNSRWGRRRSRSSRRRHRSRSPCIVHSPSRPQTPIIIHQPTPIPEPTSSGPPTIIFIPTSPWYKQSSSTSSSTPKVPKPLSAFGSGPHVPNSLESLYSNGSVLKLDPDLENTLKQSNESFLSQTWPYVLAFIIDTIPRQIYLHLLLRLPYLYFTRVSRIFEEAEMSIPEIKQGILETAQKQKDLLPHMATTWAFEPPVVSEPYQNLNKTWTTFIDSLLKEWKTLNIISVLLLTAILTILQLDGAGTDPVTRFTAMISMICALMSLLFGCMYIIRFGTMRKTYKAAEWASEAKRTRTGIFWNVWVMLAMPAAWLAWSMISYIVCVMSFVWRTGTLSDSKREPFSEEVALIPRIVVTVVLSLGLIYFCLIGLTLRRYGALMDRAWQRRIQDWIFELEYSTFQKPENPPTSQVNINVNTKPTSYSDEKIGTYKSNEPPYPKFQPPPGNLVPAPVFSFPDPKKDLKSAMGTGAKNCGIHWDSEAKMQNSVTSLRPEPEIRTSPFVTTTTTTTMMEPQLSSLFVAPASLYASVRPPTPGPQVGHGVGASSPPHTPPMLPAGPQGPTDLPYSGVICRYPARSSSSSPHSKSMQSSEPRRQTGRLSGTVHPTLVNPAQRMQPRIRVTRLVGLSEGDPFAAIPPHENDLAKCGLNVETWKNLYQDAQRSWKLSTGSYAMNVDHPIQACIAQWNDTYFKPVSEQIQLCEERGGGSPSGRRYAIYHFDLDDELPYDDTQYDTSGLDIQRVDVLGPFGRFRDDDIELRRLSLFATHLYIDDELLRENDLGVVDAESKGNAVCNPKLGHRVIDVEASNDSEEGSESE